MASEQGFTWFSNQEDRDEGQSPWQPSESTSGLKRSHNVDSMDGPICQDVKRNKSIQSIKYTSLSIEEVQEKSAQHLKQDESGTFCCLICYSYHNNPSALESHLASPEHVRRIIVVSDEDYMCSQPHCCKVCVVICSSAEGLQAHLTGKKHNKNVELAKKMETRQGVPVSRETLRSLFHVDIKQEGSAYQIGITNSMKDFYTMDGPLIGLQYAVEIDDKDSGIQYHCSICQVTSPEPNKGLHFTSYNHITSVLKKDYPERYKTIKEYENNKKDLHALLKSAAQEIEMAEGRKIAFIHRRIIEKPLPPSKGKGQSSKQKKWQKSKNKHTSGGHHCDRIKSKGDQRDTSYRSRNWRHMSTPYPQHASMVQWAHHRPSPQLVNNALYMKDLPPFHEVGITPHPNMDFTFSPLCHSGGTSATHPPHPNMNTTQLPYHNTSIVHPPLANIDITHPSNNARHHPLANMGTTQPPYSNISVSHPPPGNMGTIHPPPANEGTIGFSIANMDSICPPPARESASHLNMSTISPPTANMDRTHPPFNTDLNATHPPPHNIHTTHLPPLQRHQTQSTKDNVLEELTQAFNSSNNEQERQPLFSSLVRSDRDADLALKLSSVLTQALVSYHIKNINSTLTGPDGLITDNVKELMKDFNEQGHSSQN